MSTCVIPAAGQLQLMFNLRKLLSVGTLISMIDVATASHQPVPEVRGFQRKKKNRVSRG